MEKREPMDALKSLIRMADADMEDAANAYMEGGRQEGTHHKRTRGTGTTI